MGLFIVQSRCQLRKIIVWYNDRIYSLVHRTRIVCGTAQSHLLRGSAQVQRPFACLSVRTLSTVLFCPYPYFWLWRGIVVHSVARCTFFRQAFGKAWLLKPAP